MDANEARKYTNARIRKQQLATRQEAEVRHKQGVKWAKDHVASYIAKAEAAIERAVNRGGRGTVLIINAQPGYCIVEEKVMAYLRQRGYLVNSRYFEEDCNYGDFNAPCNVTEKGVSINITW